MIQFKIFSGNLSSDMTADIIANEWIRDNPDIRVCSYEYEQARFGDHSICIMYEEKETHV